MIHQATQLPKHALPVQGQCPGIEGAQPEVLFSCWRLPVAVTRKPLRLGCSVHTLQYSCNPHMYHVGFQFCSSHPALKF